MGRIIFHCKSYFVEGVSIYFKLHMNKYSYIQKDD